MYPGSPGYLPGHDQHNQVWYPTWYPGTPEYILLNAPLVGRVATVVREGRKGEHDVRKQALVTRSGGSERDAGWNFGRVEKRCPATIMSLID